ncbi:hypothetical protein NLU13_6488 [Sarocladium strictum]|uniref:NWD NACHT-NTPase N-terminal domain-containing protein n=1 Tax=Sarocladium strictum TaxID=5046 RepID=A0AA39GHA1_SARSR|nr:hypothetical protein NLU13_6488 [Sarocladium strictum]
MPQRPIGQHANAVLPSGSQVQVYAAPPARGSKSIFNCSLLRATTRESIQRKINLRQQLSRSAKTEAKRRGGGGPGSGDERASRPARLQQEVSQREDGSVAGRGSSRDARAEAAGNIEEPKWPIPGPQTIWDESYSKLGEEEPEMVQEYERILGLDDSTGNGIRHNRQQKLLDICNDGLEKQSQKTRLSYVVGKVAGTVQTFDGLIREGIKVSPEASIAWAGVSILLPLLTNPPKEEEENRDGLLYLTRRLNHFTRLSRTVQQVRTSSVARERVDEFETFDEQVLELFREIIEFQVRSVLRFHRSSLQTWARDAVQHDRWQDRRKRIESLEERMKKDLGPALEVASLQLQRSMCSTTAEMLAFHVSEEESQCRALFRLDGASYESYKERVAKRARGTCQWFLRQDDYDKWLNQTSGPLLVTANPGCGKSVLARGLIDTDLPLEFPGHTVCYFFFKDQVQDTLRQALCALLHQVFCAKPHLIQHALTAYRNNREKLVQVTTELCNIFKNVAADPDLDSTIVVLDALDECKPDELRDMMNLWQEIYSSTRSTHRIRCLMTGRPYEGVTSYFDRAPADLRTIRIPGEEYSDDISEEIEQVIRLRVEELDVKTWSRPLKKRLESKLLRVENRTYLWVYLVFDHLEKNRPRMTAKGVDEFFEALPESINEAYEKMLSRAKGKDVDLVREVLSMVYVAFEPLTVTELNFALHVRSTHTRLEELEADLEPDELFESWLRDSCGLILSVHHGRVYFLHQTAREFLSTEARKAAMDRVDGKCSWQGSLTSAEAHAVAARSCVDYLMFTMSAESVETVVRWAELYSWKPPERQYMFLRYVSWHSAKHFRLAQDAAGFQRLLDQLKFNKTHSDIYWKLTKSWLSKSELQVLHDAGQGPDVLLHAAAFLGHAAVMKWLLSQGADTEASSGDRGSAMHSALKSGPGVSSLQLLVEHGANIEATDGHQRTPLLVAAIRGNKTAADWLLDKGANIEATDGHQRTPLLVAVDLDNKPAVDWLLDKGANVHHTDNSGYTALVLAAQSWRVNSTIIRRLLMAGAQIEARDRSGQTALMHSVRNDSSNGAITEQLLAAGASVSPCDMSGRTALHHASKYSNLGGLRQLLDAGAAIDGRDKDGCTPFHHWARSAYASRAAGEFLSSRGADQTARTLKGETALHLAAKTRQSSGIRCLLRLRDEASGAASPSLLSAAHETTNDGSTPLHLAAEHHIEEVAAILIAAGADLNAKDRSGSTPLHRAMRGRWSFVEREIFTNLISGGADVNIADAKGRTPLALVRSRFQYLKSEMAKLENDSDNYRYFLEQDLKEIEEMLASGILESNLDSRTSRHLNSHGM